jgi:hypothetical protein
LLLLCYSSSSFSFGGRELEIACGKDFQSWPILFFPQSGESDRNQFGMSLLGWYVSLLRICKN